MSCGELGKGAKTGEELKVCCGEFETCREMCAVRADRFKWQRDGLLAALEYCRAVFDEYIGIHLDKTPPDYDKAARNENHRAACDAAIASAKGSAA